MVKIVDVKAREIFDSRGNATVEADVMEVSEEPPHRQELQRVIKKPLSSETAAVV